MTDTNAYVFAETASAEALTALAAAQRRGDLRVVCPLRGDRGLYVALVGDEQVAGSRASGLSSEPGLAGVEPYVALPPPLGDSGANPTYCAVDAWVGFAMYESLAGSMPPPGVEVAGVARVTVVGGNRTGLLIEVTAATEQGVLGQLDTVSSALGAAPSFTAWGETALGTGFRSA